MIQRVKLITYKNSDVQLVILMKKENIDKTVEQLILKHAVLLEENYDRQMDLFEDLYFDSLTWISLLIDLENEFDIVFEDELILPETFRNQNDIVNVIEQMLADAKD